MRSRQLLQSRFPTRSSSAVFPERRAHRRLPLELYVELAGMEQPAGPAGPAGAGGERLPRGEGDREPVGPEATEAAVVERAITTDISAGGLRFTSFNWRRLPVGGRFRVSISLPFESVIFTDRRRLTATATVVRWQDAEPTRHRTGPGGRPLPPINRAVALRFDEPLAFAPSP